MKEIIETLLCLISGVSFGLSLGFSKYPKYEEKKNRIAYISLFIIGIISAITVLVIY